MGPSVAAAATNSANKIHTNHAPMPTNSTTAGGISYIDVVNSAAAAAGMPPPGVAPPYDMGQQTKSMHHAGTEHLVYMPNMAAALPPQHHYLAQSLAAAQQLQQHQQLSHLRAQSQVSGFLLLRFLCLH